MFDHAKIFGIKKIGSPFVFINGVILSRAEFFLESELFKFIFEAASLNALSPIRISAS
jgi:hypothetical protein